MSLTRKSVDTLMDLVENKLGCMEVYDREDSRELARLEKCRRELLEIKGAPAAGRVVPFPNTSDSLAG